MTAPLRTAGATEARAATLLGSMRRLAAVRPAVTGRYLIKGLLDRGALSALYGPSNIGKSFLALDLAVSISAGREWFGMRVAKGVGPAVYVAAEGVAAFGNRIAAMQKSDPALIEAASAAGMMVLLVPLDLCRPDDAITLADLILDRGRTAFRPSLIVIDTLARSLGAGDENSGTDMAALAASAAVLQDRLAAHVMLVHHSGKNEARGMRGHSALHAALDTEIELSRLVNAGVTALIPRKQRDLEIGPPLHFRLRGVQIGSDEDGDPVTSAVVEQCDAPEAGRGAIVLNAARQTQAEGRAVAALRHMPTADAFTVTEAARSLLEAGFINSQSLKSARVTTERLIKKAVADGLLVALDGKRFRAADGAR